jgi:hypothetical protein
MEDTLDAPPTAVAPRRNRLRAVVAVCAALLAVVVMPAAAHAAVDPLANGPYGVNRAEYNAGQIQLTVTSTGYTCSGSSCGVSAPPTIGYGDSTHGPGNSFPQILQGSVTWPQGDPPAGGWKVVLFLHGRHSACKTSSGADGGSQTYSSGLCPYGPWPSWQGYDYLSDQLASLGYVVISPDAGNVVLFDTNTYNQIDAGAAARAEIIAQSLDLLYSWNQGAGPAGIDSSLVGKLDFSKVGIMGHSRGGEGVAQFIPYNRARPEPGRRYNLQAVFSLAPIDRNKQAPTGTNFATLLPACDGDVNTLSGANAFERGKYAVANDDFAKYEYYVEGANHNYYNSMWGSDDRSGSDPACGPSVSTRIRLTRAEQQQTGLALINTFLRTYLGGESVLQPWLTGDLGLPPGTCSTDPATHSVACPDLVKTSYIAPASQRQDVIRPASADRPTTESPVSPDSAGGAYRGEGFALFEWCNPDPFASPDSANPPATQTTTPIKACPGPNVGTSTPTSFNRSFGPQLALAWDAPAVLTAELRGSARDVSRYREVSLRAALQFTDTTRNGLGNGVSPLSATQDLEVALVDRSGHEQAAKLTDYNRPIETTLGATNATTQPRHIVLSGFEIPLSAFPDVDLKNLDRLEIRFGQDGTPTKGAIQLADVAFQELGGPSATALESALLSGPTPPTSLVPLAGDPVQPVVSVTPVTDAADGGSTGAGGGGAAATDAATPSGPAAETTAPSAAPTAAPSATPCRDTTAPTVAVRSLSRRAIRGTAADSGCGATVPAQVLVTVRTKVKGGCRFVTASGRLSSRRGCGNPVELSIGGTRAWTLALPKSLPHGSYTVTVGALDGAGNRARTTKARTLKV